MLVGLLSVGAELVAIIACTVAINKLSEIKRAVTSRAAQTTSDSPATHISCREGITPESRWPIERRRRIFLDRLPQ